MKASEYVKTNHSRAIYLDNDAKTGETTVTILREGDPASYHYKYKTVGDTKTIILDEDIPDKGESKT